MAATVIRRATVDDLARMDKAALEFYGSSRFLRGFDPERFRVVWSGLLARDIGAIFVIESQGEIVGALGGVIYPDLYGRATIATEFFWFVREQFRGNGLALYWEFENWATVRNCDQIRMVHLSDLMPERLSTVYRRLGYEPAETHYVKELKT